MTKLRPVRPNEGLSAWYQSYLERLIKRMTTQTHRLVVSQFDRTPPLAQDAKKPKKLPSEKLGAALRKNSIRWRKLFNEIAPKLAKHFTVQVAKRTDASIKSNLAGVGVNIKFKLTPAQKDVLIATFQENVALIKSIPVKYHTDVMGDVMRAVAEGGDLGPLAAKLRKQYKLTKNRAALIAHDQNSKAVAMLTRQRNIELGIKEAIWKHSRNEKHPRPTHRANDGKRFNSAKGWYDPAVGQWIQPGQLINCRCISIPVIPGLGGP